MAQSLWPERLLNVPSKVQVLFTLCHRICKQVSNDVLNLKIMEMKALRSFSLTMLVFAKYSTAKNVHVELSKSIKTY